MFSSNFIWDRVNFLFSTLFHLRWYSSLFRNPFPKCDVCGTWKYPLLLNTKSFCTLLNPCSYNPPYYFLFVWLTTFFEEDTPLFCSLQKIKKVANKLHWSISIKNLKCLNTKRYTIFTSCTFRIYVFWGKWFHRDWNVAWVKPFQVK